MSYVVSLKEFDGPLDLLLTLITRAKIAITDIFVSQITEQYLESIAEVGELDMDSASEFLQMAATLLEIKSRALLPVVKDNEDEESPEDALIRQLTEYKAFKELSKEMQALEGEAKALLTKLPEEYPLPPPTFELTPMTLMDLSRAFARVLQRIENRSEVGEPVRREIKRDSYTVQGCMTRIQSRVRKGKVSFSELFEDAPGKSEVVTVFLALLELLKLGRVKAKQRGIYEDIMLMAA